MLSDMVDEFDDLGDGCCGGKRSAVFAVTIMGSESWKIEVIGCDCVVDNRQKK